MVKPEREERRAARDKLREAIGAVLRKQYDALPTPRSDLLDDLMERIEAECPEGGMAKQRRH
jgi:hypothetical protein